MRAIAACDRRFGIAKDGKIPLPSDLPFFRKMTMGSPIIMGRKTWDTLTRKPLDGRLNIVVSRKFPYGRFSIVENGPLFYVRRSLQSAHELAEEMFPQVDAWVIGGSDIYKEAIDAGLVDEIILTRYGSIQGCDRFFPYGNELETMFPRWKVVEMNNDVEDPYIRTSYVK